MLNKGNETDAIANIATTSFSSSGIISVLMSNISSTEWIINTGAPNHMVQSLSLLK